MTNNNEQKTVFEILESFNAENKTMRYIYYGVLVVGAIYLTGHLFNIGAHTVRGYNNFRSALNGN